MRRTWRNAVAVIGTLTVLTTVFMMAAVGSHLPTDSILPNDAGELRLHMAGGSGEFTYTDTDASTVSQPLGTPDRCVISGDGALVELSGSPDRVGLKDNSLGIKSGGSTGVPCSRVDGAETLTLQLVGTPNAASADLDLELKANARLDIILKLGSDVVGSFEIRSGSSIVAGQGVDGTDLEPFAVEVTVDDPSTTTVNETIGNCKNASDSGADSGSRDNCRVSVDPGAPFDTMILDIDGVGEVSLEGSGDFAGDPTKDTIFYLTSAEGLLGCSSTNNTATDTDGNVIGTINRYENTDGDPCVLKPYSLTANATEQSVTFDVVDPVSPPQLAVYEAFITLDQDLTTPLSAKISYDATAPYETFVDMLACDEAWDDIETAPSDPEGSLNDEALPSGHTACVIDVSQEWDGTTVWHILFTADIKFR